MNTSETTTDVPILLALKSGDERVLEELYVRFGGRLLRKMIALIHDSSVAEELVHDVFVQLWQQREQLNPSASVEAVLLRKAKSIAIDHYRATLRDAKRREVLLQQATAHHEPITEMLYFKETQLAVEKAIAQLPPQRQKVFRLCKLEGKSYEFAAEAFQVSVGTIKDHMAKAMRFLKEELKEYTLELGLFLVSAAQLFSAF